MPAWARPAATEGPAPRSFNRHGPTRSGDDNWFHGLTDRRPPLPRGLLPRPGPPGGSRLPRAHLLDIVRQLRCRRHPLRLHPLPRDGRTAGGGAGSAYNAVSLARFRRPPGAPHTCAGRRAVDGMAQEAGHAPVRRIAIEARASARASRSVRPWSRGARRPPTSVISTRPRRCSASSRTGTRGCATAARPGCPMNYARETTTACAPGSTAGSRGRSGTSTGGRWLPASARTGTRPRTRWRRWPRARPEKGTGPTRVVLLLRRAAEPAQPVTERHPPSAPDPAAAAATASPTLPRDRCGAGGIRQPGPVPPMPWIAADARHDHRRGAGATGEGDGAIVKVKRAGLNLFLPALDTLEADGNGVFGLTLVKPGRYRRARRARGQVAATTEARVTAGHVTRADVQLEMAAGGRERIWDLGSGIWDLDLGSLTGAWSGRSWSPGCRNRARIWAWDPDPSPWISRGLVPHGRHEPVNSSFMRCPR